MYVAPKGPPPRRKPPSRPLPTAATQLEHFKPPRAANSVTPQERKRLAIVHARRLAQQGRFPQAHQVLRAAGVPVPRGSSIDVVGDLRAVTGIDLKRVEHPIRALQRDYHRGSAAAAAYKRGDITLAQAQARTPPSIGIVPGVPGLKRVFGRLLSREVPEAAAAGAKPVRPLTQANAEAEARREVSSSLGSARRLRAEQQKGYSAERAKRVARGSKALEEAGGGIAGFKAGMAQLRGELPKTSFERLREGSLTQADLEGLVRQAQQHPALQFYDKQRVTKALIDAWEHGVTPTKSEIKLLQTTFGQEATKVLARPKLWERAVSVATIPRSLEASFDVSAPLRQGLVAGAGHPKIFARNFPGMFRSLVSEKSYQGLLTKIHERPNFDLMKESGVKFTELGHDVSKREEAFMSDLAERIPAIGRVVHASGRAYTGFLDNLRADLYDSMVETARRKGVNVEDRRYLKGLARYVNAATGRGSMGKLEPWAPAANAFLFSPRLIAARLNMLNPVWYAHLPPSVRAQAVKSLATLLVATAAGLKVGQLAGGKVGTDPRSADFAKLKLGNTRIDPLGGFQQYGKLAAQLATGKIVSSTTGKTLALGPGFGKITRKDIIERFVAGKANPTAAALYDLAQGQTYTGGKLSLENELAQKLTPLALQDAYDQYRNGDSLPLALLAYGGSAFGLGVQTYGPKKPKATGPSRSRSNSLLQRAPRSGGSLLRSGGITSPSLLRH